MTFDSAKLARKMIGLILAILCYYIIHEGAHLIFALCTGTFEEIVFKFPGIQIKADTERLNNIEIFVFCLLGVVAALTIAYILCGISRVIERIKSNMIRAILYYITIALLLTDPLYLSILCGFFGGGDMNGISLLIPEVIARIIFGMIGVLNFYMIIKIVVPSYSRAFKKSEYLQENLDN